MKLYLFGADELEFDKIPKKTFVIYHGHHGDKAASRADLIIPMPFYWKEEYTLILKVEHKFPDKLKCRY